MNVTRRDCGHLPNLLVIGAQKCGTTSLHYYLGLHPEISMSREKELNFFVRERNWGKGIDWYRSHFRRDAKIHGESSVNYTVYPRYGGVPKKIRSVLPEAKLIYAVRDPIDRIMSGYVHEVSNGREDRSIEETLRRIEDSPHVWRSQYYAQLEQYLAYFPRTSILVITLEDLASNPKETMRQVFEFLDVDAGFFSDEFLRVQHSSAEKRRKNRIALMLKRVAERRLQGIFDSDLRRAVGRVLARPFSPALERPVLSESLRRSLADYLKDDVVRLRRLTGKPFERWSL